MDVVQNLTAIAQQNAASTEETSASVMEVSNVMQEIMENANRLKEIASILEENMNSFTFIICNRKNSTRLDIQSDGVLFAVMQGLIQI